MTPSQGVRLRSHAAFSCARDRTRSCPDWRGAGPRRADRSPPGPGPARCGRWPQPHRQGTAGREPWHRSLPCGRDRPFQSGGPWPPRALVGERMKGRARGRSRCRSAGRTGPDALPRRSRHRGRAAARPPVRHAWCAGSGTTLHAPRPTAKDRVAPGPGTLAQRGPGRIPPELHAPGCGDGADEDTAVAQGSFAIDLCREQLANARQELVAARRRCILRERANDALQALTGEIGALDPGVEKCESRVEKGRPGTILGDRRQISVQAFDQLEQAVVPPKVAVVLELTCLAVLARPGQPRAPHVEAGNDARARRKAIPARRAHIGVGTEDAAPSDPRRAAETP